MISAVITHLDEDARLGATLASLVPAAIDGLVREALVVDAGAGEALLAVAEDAGAEAIRAAGEAEGLAAACGRARGPWILILPCGTRLQAGWEAAARRHIQRRADRAGWFALALDRDGPAARVAEFGAGLAAGWLGRPHLGQSLLVPQRLIGAAASLDHAGLIRRLPFSPLGARALS
jgi:hypothetical protein